ncbi:MAG: hypothetical protein JO340_03110 [Acidobacteriaceae bacterium]|nr:hypothetical protein [Acidobacteriaceae bacterium]
MTIDERLQFLLQSTESLHSTVQEVVGGLQTLRESVAELRKAVESNSENILRLANIAAAHEQRLDNLDDRLPG